MTPHLHPGDVIALGQTRYMVAATSDQHGDREVLLAPDIYGWVAEHALLRIGWVVIP